MFGLFKKHQVVSKTCDQDTERSWRSILSNAEANDETYREALTALNVKVICELGSLMRDLSKYESFRHEAVSLALSIRNERYRIFAMKQLEGLPRRTTEVSWPIKGRARESVRASNKTPFIFRDIVEKTP